MAMKIGCCLSYKNEERLKAAKDLGFEFAEFAVNSFAAAPDEDIRRFAEYSASIGLPATAANCLFPNDYRLTGPDADFVRAGEYLYSIFERLRPLGLKHVVFGSGGARRVPEDFSIKAAEEQLTKLCADYIAPVMDKFGIICGVEELFKPACNVLNTCREVMRIVRAVDHPRIRLLVDLFHMGKEDEPVESLADYAGYISHVHISSPIHDGAFPREGDGEDYEGFYAALRAAGYPEGGFVSIEGKPWGSFEESSAEALKLLKKL